MQTHHSQQRQRADGSALRSVPWDSIHAGRCHRWRYPEGSGEMVNVIVLCNIRLKQHTHDLIQQFMDAVQSIDQITECYNTTGDYDFLIKVYARDMKDYQDFMLNTLGNISCVGSLHSVIVIGEIKDSHVIPVARYEEGNHWQGICTNRCCQDLPISFRSIAQ